MKRAEGGIINVAIGTVHRGNKLLLIKRNKEPFAGYWGMAGGKIKYGECYDSAIVRELSEETGLKVKFKSLRGIVEEFISEKDKIKAHFLLFVCETVVSGGKIKESREGELRWFTYEQIIKNEAGTIPSDFVMIKKFFSKNHEPIKIYQSALAETSKKYILKYFEAV